MKQRIMRPVIVNLDVTEIFEEAMSVHESSGSKAPGQNATSSIDLAVDQVSEFEVPEIVSPRLLRQVQALVRGELKDRYPEMFPDYEELTLEAV